MDYGHQETDKKLKSLEEKLTNNYKSASKYVAKKAEKALKKFEKQDNAQQKLYKKGLITHQEYLDWRNTHMLAPSFIKGLSETLAEDMSNANGIATKLVNNELPNIYAINRNYGMYELDSLLEINASKTFTLYDHRTVERLMRRNPEIIPKAKQDIPKDLRWNRQKITSAITQGVLTGDSIPHIASRLQKVTDMNRKAAIRNARTYTTAAENGGRVDSYEWAEEELGLEIEQEWMATLDERTRESHRLLDGVKVPIGEKFPNGLRYPGDPLGAPEEIYNCRCTLVVADPKFSKADKDMLSKRFSRLPEGMSYEEWKNAKKEEQEASGGSSPFTPDAYSEERKADALHFFDVNEADEHFRPILDEEWDKMTEHEKYAVWEYTHNSNPMNQALSGYNDGWTRYDFVGVGEANWSLQDSWRSFGTDEFREKFAKEGTYDDKDYHRAITDLTNAIEKTETQEDSWVVRGSDINGLAGLFEGDLFSFEEAKNLLENGTEEEVKAAFEGQVFRMHSFMSTGMAEGTGFTDQEASYNIYIPKGSHVLYAEPASYYGDTISGEEIYEKGKKYYGVGGEAERIVQRGSDYRVNEMTKVGWNEWYVDMDLVGQPDYFKYGDEETFNNGATRHEKRG